MNIALAATQKPVLQDLRYYVPRWMIVFLAITFIQELTTLPPVGQGLGHMLSALLIGLSEGAFGGLFFVGLQRWLNPQNTGAKRIRNYFVAIMTVGVASLFALAAVYR
jgi:hypothetical protein